MSDRTTLPEPQVPQGPPPPLSKKERGPWPMRLLAAVSAVAALTCVGVAWNHAHRAPEPVAASISPATQTPTTQTPSTADTDSESEGSVDGAGSGMVDRDVLVREAMEEYAQLGSQANMETTDQARQKNILHDLAVVLHEWDGESGYLQVRQELKDRYGVRDDDQLLSEFLAPEYASRAEAAGLSCTLKDYQALQLDGLDEATSVTWMLTATQEAATGAGLHMLQDYVYLVTFDALTPDKVIGVSGVSMSLVQPIARAAAD